MRFQPHGQSEPQLCGPRPLNTASLLEAHSLVHPRVRYHFLQPWELAWLPSNCRLSTILLSSAELPGSLTACQPAGTPGTGTVGGRKWSRVRGVFFRLTTQVFRRQSWLFLRSSVLILLILQTGYLLPPMYAPQSLFFLQMNIGSQAL